MKRFYHIIFLFPFLFVLFNCKEENPVDVPDANIEIYYTAGNVVEQFISCGDTISADLGDTLLFYLKISEIDSSEVAFSGSSNFELAETENLEYKCIAQEAGVGALAAYLTDLSEDLRLNFFINVSSFNYLIYFAEEPIFSVDVENESLKTEIEEELKNDAPDINYKYWLSCNVIDGGDLQLTNSEKDTIDGIFTSSNVLELTDLQMYCNNSSYSFTIENSEQGSYYYNFTQDLTDVFRSEYSSETINEVKITTLALKVLQ